MSEVSIEPPKGVVCLGRSAVCRCQGFVYTERVVALQFHLETTADSAAALIAHCGDEIGDGPYVQPATEMLAGPEWFDSLNACLVSVLDSLAGPMDGR